jgi:hypothetical protein
MKTLVLIVLAALTAACGSYKDVIQTDETTYLQLVGSVEGVVLVLDGAAPIGLNKEQSFDLNGVAATKFVVRPGSHHVVLKRNGALLVDRNIYVSDGNAFEVKIP